MKLQELAARSGISAASIKFYLREGVLPPGRLKNATTASYEDRHLERLAFIRTMRHLVRAPLTQIRHVTRLIDNTDVPLLDVMEACQCVALGLDPAASRQPPGSPDDDAEATAAHLARLMGWPNIPTRARASMVETLRALKDEGVSVSADSLAAHAMAVTPLARANVGGVLPGGASRDAVARSVLLGTHAHTRMLAAVSAMAHTYASIAEVTAEMPPAQPPAGR
ncbi:MAG: MerR family transcriptional regulator [Micrococcus sp.]|nr:MerR family transcriptional regulator [Micrococcus sp.]